jgi:hypothetical protein
VNRIFREHLLRNFAVLHGHAVGVMRAIQRQRNQIHFSARAAIRKRQRCDAILPKNFRGQIDGKLVESRSHRRMRGENTLLPDGFDISFGNRSQTSFPDAFLQQRENQQRGMALVHVEAIDAFMSERAQHHYPANAENSFLANAVIRIAAVQIVRKRPLEGTILGQVGIEEIDRDLMPQNAINPITPGAHFYGTAIQFKGDNRLKRLEDGFRVPIFRLFGLLALGI